MKTMQDYTNYCTEEQTRRACLLGAPLQEIDFNEDSAVVVTMNPDSRHENYWHKFVDTPTTQQMIEWIRDAFGIDVIIWRAGGGYEYRIYNTRSQAIRWGGYDISKRKVILTAIDTALDYLEKGGTK